MVVETFNAGSMVMESFWEAELEAESVTLTVMLEVPVALGVPDTTPLTSVRPLGNEPAVRLQEYPVPEPPLAASLLE